MPFEQRIYGTGHCPRCNAIAQLRTHKHEDSSMVELRLDCDKCKLSKFVKITTQRFLDLDRKEKKFLHMLERAESASRRNALLKMIEDVRKNKLVAEVQP